MKWYAFFDTGLVQPLGECQNFEEASTVADLVAADAQSPTYPVWIMDAVSFRALDTSIQNIKAQNL